MTRRSGPSENDKALRDKIIGLGDMSHKKSDDSELQRKLVELERFRALLDQSNDAVFMLSLPSGCSLPCLGLARSTGLSAHALMARCL